MHCMRTLSISALVLALTAACGDEGKATSQRQPEQAEAVQAASNVPTQGELTEAKELWEAALPPWEQKLQAAPSEFAKSELRTEANAELVKVLRSNRVLSHAAECAARRLGQKPDKVNWAGPGKHEVRMALSETTHIITKGMTPLQCPLPEDWK